MYFCLYSASKKTSFGFCSEFIQLKFLKNYFAQKRKLLNSQDSYKGNQMKDMFHIYNFVK